MGGQQAGREGGRDEEGRPGAATLAGVAFSCSKASTGGGVGSFKRRDPHKCSPGRSSPPGPRPFLKVCLYVHSQ